MNKENFINSLSNQALILMENYQFEDKKPYELIIAKDKKNPSYMDNLKEKFSIKLNPDILKKSTEVSFLHEYLHCYQASSGFPRIMPRKNTSSSILITNLLNSLVWDRGVQVILNQYNYFSDKDNLSQKYEELNVSRFDNIIDITYSIKIAVDIANLYFIFDETKILELVKIKEKSNKIIFSYAPQMIEIVSKYDYNTIKGCERILSKLINTLDLTSQVQITLAEQINLN